MIMDALLLFSDAQAVTAAAASTSSVDVGAVRNLGVGEPLYVVVTVDVALTDASSDSTVPVYLYGDSTSSFTPDASQLLFTIPALAAAGNTYVAQIAHGAAGNYRYLELYYDVQGGNLTTGSFTAFITKDVQAYTSYADSITVS